MTVRFFIRSPGVGRQATLEDRANLEAGRVAADRPVHRSDTLRLTGQPLSKQSWGKADEVRS